MFITFSQGVIAQHTNEMTATIDDETKEISIKQKFTYVNTSETTLDHLYFNDWNNAYSSKTTPLAKRFGEEFKKSLHLARNNDRGRTTILSVVESDYSGLSWERTKSLDILKVVLKKPLLPSEAITIFFTYTVKLPKKRFTGYGFNTNGNYYLKDWYLNPAVFDGDWKLYSNKNLEDNYTDICNTSINFIFPKNTNIVTNYDESTVNDISKANQISLRGDNRTNCEIIITKEKQFTKHSTKYLTVKTDLELKKGDKISQAISIEKVSKFISENLGEYPHKSLLVSKIDYNKSPLYGSNLLPSFIRLYQEEFQFEMTFLKTALNYQLKESLFLDPRKERWVNDAIVNYLMIKYVNTFYKDKKLSGRLSNIWGFRNYNIAQQSFNDQYYLLQMFVVRRNDDQKLSTPNDSLIWFNHKIANRYKAGLGLAYLSEYIGYDTVDSVVKHFYEDYKLKPKTKALYFGELLKENTEFDIDWFFKEYIDSRTNIDFKIKNAKIEGDSITLKIKNKKGSNIPISVFGLKKDAVISKYWFTGIDSTKTVKIPYNGEKRLVLNYDKKIPEINQRDNWKNLGGFLASNKKFKFQFFKDTENPYYNQIFYIPEVRFNVDNGINPRLKITNKTFLERPFTFSVSPGYSFAEKALLGSAGFGLKTNLQNKKLNFTRYAFNISTAFFDENSRFTTLTPSVGFSWRPEDRISNVSKRFLARYRTIFRDFDENLINPIDTENDFSVLNFRYSERDNNILNFKRWAIDAQLADRFSRVSFEWDRRILFDNNKQLNLRFFAGKFITNNTDSDFFSFALDRPSDYLFDLSYLSRSATSGLASQQIIITEGGFKSIFDDRFGNDWVVTGNASINIWQWVELYGDIGAIKNTGENARFVYDSGVRLNLVTGFFELYFPVYSNNGYEIFQPNYNDRIRFVITPSIKTLTRLFTRKWF